MEATKKTDRYGKRFERPVILHIVAQAEKGISRQRLADEYGVTKETLINWLNRYGSAEYHAGKRKVYPIEYRRSIVRAIEQGRMTLSEAIQQCNFKDGNTINKWLRTFRQENPDSITPSLAKMKDKKSAKTESEEINALKKALEAAQLKVAALETLVDVAERELNIDIRKKPGAKQSPK